jgi:DNA-binding PadR family transcriptional regulator
MPTKERTPDAPLTNDLILAAIERAICHRGRDLNAESLSAIKQHLGLPHNGWTTLQLRPNLEALETAGLIEQSRRDRTNYYGLTTDGHKRLDVVRAEITLPEAPQHQRWREARTAAGERIAGFRGDLRGALDEAVRLLEADTEADSATWFDLSERLHQAGRRFASAIYCLREWPEPDDSRRDSDEDASYGQHVRRQTYGWDSKSRF